MVFTRPTVRFLVVVGGTPNVSLMKPAGVESLGVQAAVPPGLLK
jgi:hypothetical protein